MEVLAFRTETHCEGYGFSLADGDKLYVLNESGATIDKLFP